MGRRIKGKHNIEFGKICNSHNKGRFFSYANNLYRINIVYGDDGMIAHPENIFTGRAEIIPDDTIVRIIRHDIVLDTMQRMIKRFGRMIV